MIYEYKNVLFERKGHIGVITLNRPPVNALTVEMYGEIADVFTQTGADDGVWVAVLLSAGKHFSVGNDMAEFDKFGEESMRSIVPSLKNAMCFPKPLICAVQGMAMGAAMAYVCAADILIAGEDAAFCLAEINIGLVATLTEAANSLPMNLLRYMALTGEAVEAEVLEKHGAVHAVVPRADLRESALALAAKIEDKPPLSVRRTKAGLQGLIDLPLRIHQKAPIDYDANTYYLKNTLDHKEAVAAFMEKRKPVFRGK